MKVSILLGGLLPVLLLLLSPSGIPAGAQQSATATAVRLTAEPTIAALESVIATQQVRIDALERGQAFEVRERELGLREINSQWKLFLALGGIAAAILTWFGISNVRDAKLAMERQVKSIEQKWEGELQATLDRAVYRLDLSKLPIYLPAGERLENIHRFLQKRQFANVGFYQPFQDVERGVYILSLAGKDEAGQAALLKDFKQFVKAQRPDISRVGFIIYAPAGIRVPGDVMECYDNLVTANYPATVVSSIFTVGRGIEMDRIAS